MSGFNPYETPLQTELRNMKFNNEIEAKKRQLRGMLQEHLNTPDPEPPQPGQDTTPVMVSRPSQRHDLAEELRQYIAGTHPDQQPPPTPEQERARQTQQLKNRADELEAQNQAMALQQQRAQIAAEHGIPADLLTGTTAEELTTQAQQIKKWSQQHRSAATGGMPEPEPDKLEASLRGALRMHPAEATPYGAPLALNDNEGLARRVLGPHYKPKN